MVEAVLMRSFLMLYLIDYDIDDYMHATTDDGLPYRTAKFSAEHRSIRSFTLLSSVCWNWHQTLIGFPQSSTHAWVRHQLKKLMKCECTLHSYTLGLLLCSCFIYVPRHMHRRVTRM